jgi:hypothetical protein
LGFAVLALILILSSGFSTTTITNDVTQNVPLDDIQASQDELLPIWYFDENILLSTDDSIYPHHVEVTMAITEEDVMFVGWKNSETHNGGGARVSYVKSTDNGETWSHPRDMPMFGSIYHTRQSDPWMAWHNGTLYYAYLEFTPDLDYTTEEGFSQITIAKSADLGETWSPVKASFGHGFADKETMVVSDDGIVYMAYDDIQDDGAIVELGMSLDGGDSYQGGGVIGEKDDGHVAPYLATSSTGDIYCVWSYFGEVGGDILFDKSLDGGVSFGQEVFINNDGNYSEFTEAGGRPAKGTLPVIRFDDSDRLYLLWADLYEGAHDTFDVFLRYSDDFGQSWSDRLRINYYVAGNQWNPELAIDSEGTLHIAYYNDRLTGYRPYYRALKFTGPQRDTPEFGDEMVIASIGTDESFTRPGEYFSIQLDSDEIPHVVWSDGRNGEMDIYYARGITEPPEPITTTSPTNTHTSYTTRTTEPGELAIVEFIRWVLIVGGIAGLVAIVAMYWNRKTGFG